MADTNVPAPRLHRPKSMCYVAWHPERHASFFDFPRAEPNSLICALHKNNLPPDISSVEKLLFYISIVFYSIVLFLSSGSDRP
ncbi:Uncharacterised protein [Escherichia coli]|uniref:Uncharacterized protein n=1 Tax=Escherichia coli TaxID=562 RepID=A0A377F4R5_ECOLX|nr:Uncharacterised protein [Escherichia coli]